MCVINGFVGWAQILRTFKDGIYATSFPLKVYMCGLSALKGSLSWNEEGAKFLLFDVFHAVVDRTLMKNV